MNHLARLLKTFDYHSITAFIQSLLPSIKYNFSGIVMIGSAVFVSLDKIFGLDGGALVALVLVFIFELITGIWAAHLRGETISSIKLSRFSLKVACYLVLISASYLMATSFASHHKDVAAWGFDWLHVFLLGQIVLENTVSILENLASINGKDKSLWIKKIQDKFNSIFG